MKTIKITQTRHTYIAGQVRELEDGEADLLIQRGFAEEFYPEDVDQTQTEETPHEGSQAEEKASKRPRPKKAQVGAVTSKEAPLTEKVDADEAEGEGSQE